MQEFRYREGGIWYKGNTHIHSTVSDGGKSFAELAAMYAAEGYDFLFRTDHMVPSDVEVDDVDYPLLWLDGIEIHGEDETGAFFHVACLGRFPSITEDTPFPEALRAAREAGGLLILAHPYWTGNSLEDALRWEFDGVEAYNNVCEWLNGKGHGGVHWHAMLAAGQSPLGIAADDAHLRPEHPTWNGGWIVAQAPELTRGAIFSAIRAGRFYSSQGPSFESIALEGDEVVLRTSPVRFVRLVGPGWLGQRVGALGGDPITEIRMPCPTDWDYVYAEIEDENHRRAWTNTLFVER
jgi:hypothetical protein